MENKTNIPATYDKLELTISEPMVKNPPVAEDNYCYVCIFLKKSNFFNTMLIHQLSFSIIYKKY
jgi:hypothetical protein